MKIIATALLIIGAILLLSDFDESDDTLLYFIYTLFLKAIGFISAFIGIHLFSKTNKPN